MQPRQTKDSRQSAAYKYKQLPEVQHASELDTFTRLAAWVTGTPIALISVTDGERQPFRSVVGQEMLGRNASPPDSTFIAETIVRDKPLMVIDAKRDARFANDPMVVQKPGVRFFVGVPLIVHGQRLGVLCVIDRRARRVRKLVLDALSMLAREASQKLESRLRPPGAAGLRRSDVNLALQSGGVGRGVLHPAELDGVIAKLPIMFWSTDEKGRCVYANEQWRAWSGIGDNAGLTDWDDGIHTEDLPRVVAARTRAVELHDAFDVEYRRRVPGGQVRFVRSVAKPRYDESGKFLGLLGCCVDATERALAAASRPEPAPKPSLPLSGRSAEAMDIAFTITHDMQNPLATMSGQVALLRNAMKTGIDAEKHVERLQAGLDKLRGIVDSLMTLAREEQESLEPVTLNAEAVVRECVEQLRPLAERDGVLIATSTTPATVYADRKAFERVVMNLVSNAVKFTALSPASRQVGVSLASGRDAVRLEVVDTGPGIPPDQLESVFRPFGRAERRAPGTGLGLHSVRRYVETFGGRVWLESDGRCGTKAVVELPVRSVA